MRSTHRTFTLIAIALCACGRTQLDVGADARDGSSASGDTSPSLDATTRPPDSGGAITADGPPGASDAGPEPVNPCFDSGCGSIPGPGGSGGCCAADGTCLIGGTTDTCGVGGELCRTCPPGDYCGITCEHYQFNCGPTNCAGCCTPTFDCAVGNSPNACGMQGQPCLRCAMAGDLSGSCIAPADGGAGRCSGVASGAGTCTPTNCSGCCDGNQCVPGTSDAQCGPRGTACKRCAASETCEPISGECTPKATCNASNCSGCCAGGVCAVGNQDVACGTDGGPCSDCTGSQKACMGSMCQ